MLESPLVAAAVTKAVHVRVTNEDFYTDQVALSTLPHLLMLLLHTARLQPRLHSRLLLLCRDALRVVGAERPEAAKSVIHILVVLLLLGDPITVLEQVADWAKDADPALVRFFIGQVRRLCDMLPSRPKH
jgi:hypothetical protein